MHSKILLSVLVFVAILFAVLLFSSIFTSCADDLTPSNGLVNYMFTDYDDSLTVLSFEVLGTTSTEKRQFYVNYSSDFHSSGVKMVYFENGSMTLDVFQDTAKISSLKVSNVTDTALRNIPGKPTRILITPENFTGSGYLYVKKP
jgi:hypothetical protein